MTIGGCICGFKFDIETTLPKTGGNCPKCSKVVKVY